MIMFPKKAVPESAGDGRFADGGGEDRLDPAAVEVEPCLSPCSPSAELAG